MAIVRIAPLDPLQHNAAIVDKEGRPTPLFMQQWAKSREVSIVVDETVGAVENVNESLDANYYTRTQSDLRYYPRAEADAKFETLAHAAATYETLAHAAATYETIANAAATYALISHTHGAAAIVSGNLDQARLPSGSVTWTATNVTFSGPVLIPAGTGGAPGLAFSTDVTTGMFSVGAGTYRFIAGGVLRFAGTTTETIFFGTFRGDGGAIFQQDLKLGYVEAGTRIIAGDYADTTPAAAASIWISNPFTTPAHEMHFISRQGILFRVDSTSMGPLDALKLTQTQGAIFYGVRISMANLPTSAAGLTTGDLWNNSGVVNVA